MAQRWGTWTAVAGAGLVVVAIAACGNDDGEVRAQGPSATLSSGPSSTADTEPTEAVAEGAPAPADADPVATDPGSAVMRPDEKAAVAAYLASWERYAGAVESLDSAGLEKVFDGAALELRRAQVDQHRAEGTNGRIGVTHGIELVTAEGDNAAVIDRYVDRSEVHRATGGVVHRAPGDVVTLAANLSKVEGRWKVIELTVVAVPSR